jgi:hypothetical protein
MALKLYTLVRNDLRFADKAVQSTHAVANFAVEHPKEFKEWQAGSNTLVVLEVPGWKLTEWAEVLADGDYKFSLFNEPDRLSLTHGGYAGSSVYGDVNVGLATALTVEPNWLLQNILFRDLPLASFSAPSVTGVPLTSQVISVPATLPKKKRRSPWG